jgi:hypothetical protein
MNQVNEENESDIKNKNLTRKEEWCGGEEGGRMLRRQLDTREWEEKRKMRVYCLCSGRVSRTKKKGVTASDHARVAVRPICFDL